MRTVLTAGAIVSGKGHLGTAIAIEDETIVDIGDARVLRRPSDRVVAYDGGFVVPGFRDAHIHAIPYAALLNGCSLKAATSIDDLITRLSAYARSLPPGAPVVASRFDDESLVEKRLPTRQDLDRAVPDKPAVIYRYCGHIAVANSAALKASGITQGTPDPPGGALDREAGEPTGVLRETATGLVSGALARGAPLPAANLIDGLTRLAGLGITSIGAMVGYGESPHEKLHAESELFRDIAAALPLRVNAISIASTPGTLNASAAAMTGAADRLTWLGVKRFSDGSLGGHTAAMCSPFSDVDTMGTYRLTADDVAVSRHSLALGGMVAIHAIGDRAVDDVLNVFEDLVAGGANPADLRMEHVSVASPQLVARFAETGHRCRPARISRFRINMAPKAARGPPPTMGLSVSIDVASWHHGCRLFRQPCGAAAPFVGNGSGDGSSRNQSGSGSDRPRSTRHVHHRCRNGDAGASTDGGWKPSGPGGDRSRHAGRIAG
ncbi:MAG: amidohydrolase family protein [Actinomycetota bacterium]|nr:amidohydrolase family protein [Actinomycetota bacterium]